MTMVRPSQPQAPSRAVSAHLAARQAEKDPPKTDIQSPTAAQSLAHCVVAAANVGSKKSSSATRKRQGISHKESTRDRDTGMRTLMAVSEQGNDAINWRYLGDYEAFLDINSILAIERSFR